MAGLKVVQRLEGSQQPRPFLRGSSGVSGRWELSASPRTSPYNQARGGHQIGSAGAGAAVIVMLVNILGIIDDLTIKNGQLDGLVVEHAEYFNPLPVLEAYGVNP